MWRRRVYPWRDSHLNCEAFPMAADILTARNTVAEQWTMALNRSPGLVRRKAAPLPVIVVKDQRAASSSRRSPIDVASAGRLGHSCGNRDVQISPCMAGAGYVLRD